MANTTPPPKIFLSYSWANVNVADEIDNDFKAVGITFQRDVRDVKYTESIKKFMERIGESGFVVMLISDEYIRSTNCMHEVTELFNTHKFEERILPVIVNDTAVFNSKEQEIYYDYWQERVDDTKRLFSKHQNEKTIEDRKKVQNIYDCLGMFFQKITELKSEKFEELKTKNYRPMLDKIGFQQEEVLERLLEIMKIKDAEEQDLAFEEIFTQHADDQNVLFYRAYVAKGNGQFKKAKRYYEELLKICPDHYNALNNLAIIMENNFSMYEDARLLFNKALLIDSDDAELYYNIAHLFHFHFSKDEARKYYEKAIEINPQHFKAHNNFATLLWQSYEDYTNARIHYEKALAINPLHANAQNNFGILLMVHFEEYDRAKEHFERALVIEPNLLAAHYHLAILYEHLQNYQKAKDYYEITAEIDPQFQSAKENLANLIKNHFS